MSDSDATEQLSRAELATTSGADLADRTLFEVKYGVGNVFNTQELVDTFDVKAFFAPYVAVVHRASGKRGTLQFRSHPRVYFNWQADKADDNG